LKLLKKRKISIIIAAIVIVFATLLGVNISLNRLARNVEAMFYDGVFLEDAGFRQTSINQHLDNLAQAALDISSVFRNHDELSSRAEELILVRRDLLDARSIRDKYIAYQGIQSAGTALINEAQSVELNRRDMDSLAQFQMVFHGATGAIQNSDYNIRARDFMDESSFIAQFLRPFVFVTPPQTFA